MAPDAFRGAFEPANEARSSGCLNLEQVSCNRERQNAALGFKRSGEDANAAARVFAASKFTGFRRFQLKCCTFTFALV
jgi:hypothetical protein